jgi:hypothetical protein
MRTIELAPAIWSDYFATLTVENRGVPTRVQALYDARRVATGAAIGRPLRGISFDDDRRLIELSVGGTSAGRPEVHYFVDSPRRVIEIEATDLRRFVILDADGLRTLVSLGRWASDARGRTHRRAPSLINSAGRASGRRLGACGIRGPVSGRTTARNAAASYAHRVLGE